MEIRSTPGILLLALIFAMMESSASAQGSTDYPEGSTVSDQAPVPAETPNYSSPPFETKQPTLMEEPLDEQAAEEDYFFWLTVAPEVGYLFFPRSALAVQDYTAKVEPRNGFAAKLHFDMGGDGLAVEIAPMFVVEAGGVNPTGGGFGNIGVDFSEGLFSGTFQGIGAQFAVVYRFEVGRFFPSIGGGFHGNYLWGSEIEYGTELYGRIPIGATVYVGKNIGLVFEIGLMYGVTGIKTPFRLPDSVPADIRAELDGIDTPEEFELWYENPDNQTKIQVWIDEYHDQLPENYDQEQMARDFVADQVAESIRFGPSFGIDISIGIRFP